MFTIETYHTINAEQATVWKILTDFEIYSEWNPFIVKATKTDEEFSIVTKLPNEKEKKFNPKITVFQPNTELRWIGKIFSKYLLQAEHCFELQQLENKKTKLTHKETFSGMLTYLVGQAQRELIRKAFETMNTAIALRALVLDKH